MGIVQNLALSLGTTVPALTVATTLFSGYLLAIIYRKSFFDKPAQTQWLYFTISGFSLVIFNYGFDAYHSLICVLLVWALCKFLPGTSISVVVAFLFLMGHLLLGYHLTATDMYDIKWTLPQCILTLRLIGLVWDVYDGQQPQESLSEDQKTTALKDSPSLLEIAAYTYFFGSFLVGPQYPLTRFRKFVTGDFNDPKTGKPRQNWTNAMLRLLPGIIYMCAHFYYFMILPTEYFMTEEFRDESFGWKFIHVTLWYRFILFRYQAVWLVTEGSCILSVLAYNGVDKKTGKDLWDGVRNIRLTKFEFGYTFQSVIESFNYNTNQWAARYIFKRLKFLGNKTASHLATLVFLALWHGFYSGYYLCFLFEYVCVVAERQASSLMDRLPRFRAQLNNTWMWYPAWIVKKFIITSGCVFGFLPFALLTFERWFMVYKLLFFYGYVIYFFLWQILNYILRRSIPKNKEKVGAEKNGPSSQKED